MKNRICKAKDHLISNENFEVVWSEYKKIAKTHPRPKENKLKTYYDSKRYVSHNPKSIGVVSLLYLAVRAIMTKFKLKMIGGLISGNDKILDFGSGTGSFLKKLSVKYDSYGLEPNDYARRIAIKKGLKVQKILDAYKITFSMIFLWHSLEHVYDINKTIDVLRKKIKSNGFMVIALPNLRSYDAKKYNSFWAGYDVPRHVWHFTEEGLIDFLKVKNFEFIKKRPLFWDAIYVSYLSEKYKKNKFPLIKGVFWGIISNIFALKTGEYSSKVYFFKKTN